VDGRLALRVRVLSADGVTALEERAEGALAAARHVGEAAARALLARGAGALVGGR
jgi:porphobilinogen deaminase